jgi:DNA-binding LacI/PurR family transcriptional regulator
VGDAISSDAITCIARSSAGRHPRARLRPAWEEDAGGTESAVSHIDVAEHQGARWPQVSSSKVAQRLSILSAPITLDATVWHCQRNDPDDPGEQAVWRAGWSEWCTKLSVHAALRYTPAVTSTSETRPRRTTPTTIADIAELTGVSVPTVSKVINGRSDVSAETRRRVETAIREHGYRRSPGARPRAPLLEVIFHELESEWALEIVRGVERVAGRNHLAVVLSEMQGRRTPGRGWIEGVLARRPTGVIAVFSDLSDSMRSQLSARGIPYVVVDPTGEPLHDTPSIGATNWNGGLTATRHLLSLGHRRIGVIGGPEWILCSRARIDGYRAAMDEAGVEIAPELISHGHFHVEEGYDRGKALLALKDRPTAIFAGNDLQALGVYQAAREARLHIPEDLSVVGFDDLPLTQWVSPPMTTIRQPLVHMAEAAAELVLAIARGETPAQPRVELATELIVRESTAPPPA